MILKTRASTAAGMTLVGMTLLITMGACHSWARQDTSPQTAVAAAGSGPIRVSRTDHSVIELKGASIVNDSLIGYATADKSNDRVAIPLTEVASVSKREVDAGRTAGLAAGTVIGLIALTGLLAAIALAQVWGSSN